ncbi:hypothetical protein GCM10010423_72610 [Streptomyces levis]|uniref:Uncharacterized protein n=2 Tax=Streptomyces levis TaxID=285566 RepID=A0ABN3P336_9ACTN
MLSHDPAEINDREEPIEPTDRALPIEPTDKAEPTDPTDSTDPTEPIDSTESCDHNDSTEPEEAQRTDRADSFVISPSCPLVAAQTAPEPAQDHIDLSASLLRPAGQDGAMAPTDLSRLQLPRACREALAKQRSERIDGHTIPVATHWWNTETAAAHLPGTPVTEPGVTELSRGDLFRDAANLDPGCEEELLRFLWRVLAWGSGMRLRLNRRRIRAVADNPSSAVAALRQALQAARENPAHAYEALRPEGRNAIAYLGPAFSTKVLYFAGGGALDHPCVILDSQVAATLRDICKWDSLGKGGWPTSTYVRYCALLDRWAREESRQLGRHIGTDEIERWLFRP